MIGVWLIFAAVLFLIEPFIARHVIHERAARAPEATLARMLRLHRVMLTLSLLATFAAVCGSHGFF